MQAVAQAALVLKLTGSGTQLGLVTAAQFLPVFVFGPYEGVLASRLDTRRVIRITQLLFLVDSLVLGVLTIAGTIPVWLVYALALLAGLITSVDTPARQAVVFEVVGPEVLANAVTLNFIVMNVARIVGPAATGLLVRSVGIGPCFCINAATFMAPIVAFALMDGSSLRARAVIGVRARWRDGFVYVWADRSLRSAILVMALLGAFTYEFQVTLPLLGERTFGGDAGTYAWMFAAMGAGGIVSCTAISVAPNLTVAMLLLPFVSAANLLFVSIANATLQLSSAADMRTRVMAMYAVAFIGTTPIGAPIIGAIGQSINPRVALAVSGLAALLGGLIALRRIAFEREDSVALASENVPAQRS